MPVCTFDGLLLPLFREDEEEWPNAVRMILYLFGLGWCFLGVGVVSDVFMSAIEKITSKKKRVINKTTGRYVTVPVWNDTVSNLTLMALGSSAPEIMLSVIEIGFGGFFSGDLGPSTIIGSAAFNLLCISAVCVSAIPDGEVRFIKELSVYAITATCSVLAYLWLLVILLLTTPDVVDIWEGLLTLFYFPILVVLAFWADKGYFTPGGKQEEDPGQGKRFAADCTKEELAQIETEIRKEHGAELSDRQVLKIMECHYFGQHSRAFYRNAAIRQLTGARRLHVTPSTEGVNMLAVSGDPQTRDEADKEQQLRGLEVGFVTAKHAVLENCGIAKVPVGLSSPAALPIVVRYKTRDGSAQDGTDYVAADDEMVFAPGETLKFICITVVDDSAYEEDEEFYVDLSDPQYRESHGITPEPPAQDPLVLEDANPGNPSALRDPELGGASTSKDCDVVLNPQKLPLKLSDIPTTAVVIIDDDEPGNLRFRKEHVLVEDLAEDHVCKIEVERYGGASGTVGCHYYTENGTAIETYDYEAVRGYLEFQPGQQTAVINLTIKAVGRYENKEDFRVIIEKATGGAKFDAETDGAAEMCICTITIQADQKHKQKLDRLMSSVHVNWHKMSLGHTNWKSQFYDAIRVGADEDEDDEEEEGGDPSVLDYVMHVFALPWKLLFALIPPVDYCGGWLCFVISLIFIALVTAVVSDMASLLGCTLQIEPEITAITFVALGTSLPDTFASKAAAVMDPYADASIGNVTGSNSVNVFLGLGLPWTMAAIYWAVSGQTVEWSNKFGPGGVYEDVRSNVENVVGSIIPGSSGGDAAFVVPSGSLWFNLMVFSANAACAIGLLGFRRYKCGGELGGTKWGKRFSSGFLFFQWVIYISASSTMVTLEKDR
mmetsp:Transcript_26599/g.61110  ORF Transcript_26599/g.61110 Transcript_26599/m.61110 type:complete len:887 (+) Transcript_26599:194-2854(+)